MGRIERTEVERQKKIVAEHLNPLREALRGGRYSGIEATILCMARAAWRERLHCSVINLKKVGHTRLFPSLGSQSNYVQEWARANKDSPVGKLAVMALAGLALLGPNPHHHPVPVPPRRRTRAEWEALQAARAGAHTDAMEAQLP